jgi:hypothetical protein
MSHMRLMSTTVTQVSMSLDNATHRLIPAYVINMYEFLTPKSLVST